MTALVAMSVIAIGAVGCSGSGPAAGPDTTASEKTDESGTEANDAEAGPSAGAGTDGRGSVEVQALLDERLAEVPVPASVAECLSAALARDGDLAQEWQAADAGAVPDGVLSEATRCVEVERAAPTFVQALDAQVPAGLTSEQAACVAEGYMSLPAEVLEAARDEALGGSSRVRGAEGVGQMVEGCGVKGLGE